MSKVIDKILSSSDDDYFEETYSEEADEILNKLCVDPLFRNLYNGFTIIRSYDLVQSKYKCFVDLNFDFMRDGKLQVTKHQNSRMLDLNIRDLLKNTTFKQHSQYETVRSMTDEYGNLLSFKLNMWFHELLPDKISENDANLKFDLKLFDPFKFNVQILKKGHFN